MSQIVLKPFTDKSQNDNIKFNNFMFNTAGSLPSVSTIGANSFQLNRTSQNNRETSNIDWSADYRKTSKKEGEEFSVSAQASIGRNIDDFSTLLTSPSAPTNTIIRDNTGKNNEYTIQSDYTYPFSKIVTLETGLKGVFRVITSNFKDTKQNFDYGQDVSSAYGVLAFNLTKKITAKAGLRAENTQINGLSGNTLNFKNNYFNLFPSAILSQKLKGNATLKLSYNRRIQRPSLFFINPFRNDADPNNVTEGNPNLAPEISENMELGYSTYIKGSVFNASVFYRNTSNLIESFYTPGYTTYINAGKNKSFGFNVFGSYNPLPKWTLMANLGVDTYNLNNNATNVKTGTFVNYNGFARSAVAFKKGWSTEMVFAFSAARRTLQGATDGLQFFIASVKKDILNKKGSIGFNTLNPFARDLHISTKNQGAGFLQTSDIYYPIRSFGINFSYKFGKINFNAKPKKNKLNNDDLKQGEQQQGGQMGNGGQGK